MSPNPKINSNQNSNPNRGAIFFVGNYLVAPNPKTNPNLDPNPNPKQGGNFPREAIVRIPFLDPVVVWICRMGEIVCFSARFFIHPNYTKEFENTYKKGCLITKISSKIKMPPFRSFLLKKGVSKLQRKRILTNTQNIQQKYGFSFKDFFWKLEEQFLKDDLEFLLLARCLLELLPSLILLTLCNFCLCCVLCKIVELTFSKVHQH